MKVFENMTAVTLVMTIPVLVLLAPALSAVQQPNVLFIAVDDMNDWIGSLNTTPSAVTPNIDRLAARGVNFSNAHTAGVYCAPSRSAIFTGQFASTTGCYTSQVYFENLPDLVPLQMSFKNAGYVTYGTGKLFHHPAGYIDRRGWDEFKMRADWQKTMGWPLESWSEETPIPQPYPHSVFRRANPERKSPSFLEWGKVDNDREAEMADTMRADYAIARIKEKHDKPFFIGVGLYAPHFPNFCPAKYWDLYETDKIELPPYKVDDLDDLPEAMRKKKIARSKIHQQLEELGAVKEAIHAYLACMSYADAQIGRVLDALDASPYADNTIVVLWSDHGYHHGEKGDWGKHTLWERTSNVPFVWAGPSIAAGAKTDVSASLIDMYPTFVELCGLSAPTQPLDGQSLAALLKDPNAAQDRDVYLPYMDPEAYAIINRDWRYIHYQDGTEELYDLSNDPNEWFNLAGSPEHQAQKAELKAKAPSTFAQPGHKFSKKQLVIEGESFHWGQKAGQ